MALAKPVPIRLDPATCCPDCGGRKRPESRRCIGCHARLALAAARASPAYSVNRPLGGPIGDLVRIVGGRGVVVRPFHDRRGGVVVAADRIVFVELEGRLRLRDRGRHRDAPDLSDAGADWLYRLDRAATYSTAIVRDVNDLRRLADGLPRRSRPG
jgi:hypothetical protein